MPARHREALRAAGVLIEPFRPIRLSTLHLAQNRSHVRGIIIDGRIGWTGGFGIDDKWYGDGHTGGSWRETNARFEGPAVRQLQAAFAAAWVEATGELVTGRGSLQTYADGVDIAGLLSTSPTLGSTAAERFSPSPLPRPGRHSTSPTRTSRRTAASSRCWPRRPDEASTCGC